MHLDVLLDRFEILKPGMCSFEKFHHQNVRLHTHHACSDNIET
jgi:hypothetical protein